MDGQPPAGPAAPRWRRRATPRPQPLAWSKLRPQSYQSPSGVLVTDFPVEDRCAFPVTQPAGTGTRSPGSPAMGSVSNGTVRRRAPPRCPRSGAPGRSPWLRTAPSVPPPTAPSPRRAAGRAAGRGGPPAGPCAEPPALLSTHSPAARRVGSQQLIPRSLAESRPAGHERGLKARSLVETPRLSLGSDPEDEPEGGPGALRRGLRSTSYRRAVVSGVDLDGSANCKKQNRMSQPVLKAVVEDKEKFSSLGRIKKMLKGQGTFDGEENAVLYQNYKEKALDIDSDEECEPQEQKLDDKVVFPYKPLRSTWSQLSVVKKNGLSEAISQEERKRQEAIFEVISSEHSYLLSLEILIRMFKNSRELSLTMTKTESHHLFSNITDVYEASKKFFEELEARHQSSVFIDDISDIVARHAGCSFDPYVKYCTNEVYQQRTLQRLLATNPAFKEVLSRIESHEDCRNLPMISFLILPMQRVTRLPLLMDTICQKTPKDSAKYENCKQALKEVSKLVRLCNEGARKMERTEMMYTINSQLEFKIKPFPLVSSSRWLVKRGELTAYVEDTGLFSKRTSKQQVYFFLFNDVLIITKKKSEESYNVTEHSLREQLQVLPCAAEEPGCSPARGPAGMLHSGRAPGPHLFRLVLLSNHAGDRVQMLLGAETQSDRARWITALGQDSEGHHTDRTTLAQVEIIRTYTAKQADELSLQVADVVLVYQKVNDGWYEGERLRDGQRGWFPSECAREITCRATLDKNMERMGRLLGLETNV
ncbi:LOW QUALITY PROTEIN: rho guanine nucleotide exchange factor 26 [Passer montanus]|uniref:LOW QUALITY PROTEIN: rho guanine nucleotide exchange factor 26 n=1 Tax=Passer montanus TaxID=9160 RepID=UPI001961A3A0|nr:LOW QUALITY PROTEIN: rho guanine nucleotide exchange factor 26 [Passer montanus]